MALCTVHTSSVTWCSRNCCQASELVSLQADAIISYGDKIRLPEEPLDIDNIKAYLQVDVAEDGDGNDANDAESVDRLVSLASHSDLPQDTPFQSVREFAGSEVEYIEKCAQWSALQVHGCRAVLAARHLQAATAQEAWPTVAKDVLQKLRVFSSALGGLDEGDLPTISCVHLLRTVLDQAPWDSIAQETVAATADYQDSYREVFTVCVNAVFAECCKELQRAIASLTECFPEYESKIADPDAEAPWIRRHVFANPHHKGINTKKDALQIRTNMLEGSGNDEAVLALALGGRATRTGPAQAALAALDGEAASTETGPAQAALARTLTDAKEQWKAAHNYLGIVSVLNCILNRPLEVGVTATDLEKHVAKTKKALQSKCMEVPENLMHRLDEVPHLFRNGIAPATQVRS